MNFEREEEIPRRKKLSSLMMLRRLIMSSKYLQTKKFFVNYLSYGCLLNVLTGGGKSFAIAYIGKLLFSLISYALKPKGKKFLKLFIEEDTLRFAAMPTIYTSVQKGNDSKTRIQAILCFARSHSDTDKKIFAFVSGYVAGILSLMIMPLEKRKNWALYLFTRSLDSVFQSLQNKGIIRVRRYYYVVLMFLQQLVMSYANGYESDALEEYMRKFYRRFGCETQNELDFRECWHETKKHEL